VFKRTNILLASTMTTPAGAVCLPTFAVIRRGGTTYIAAPNAYSIGRTRHSQPQVRLRRKKAIFES
jgi:hypothetical protein